MAHLLDRQTREASHQAGGERIGDVVETEELELFPSHQLQFLPFAPHREHPVRREERPFFARVRLRGNSEIATSAGTLLRHLQHRRVLAVQHPVTLGVGVLEQACFVRVVTIHVDVAIEMVRAQIEEHADRRLEALDMGELK